MIELNNFIDVVIYDCDYIKLFDTASGYKLNQQYTRFCKNNNIKDFILTLY